MSMKRRSTFPAFSMNMYVENTKKESTDMSMEMVSTFCIFFGIPPQSRSTFFILFIPNIYDSITGIPKSTITNKKNI